MTTPSKSNQPSWLSVCYMLFVDDVEGDDYDYNILILY